MRGDYKTVKVENIYFKSRSRHGNKIKRSEGKSTQSREIRNFHSFGSCTEKQHWWSNRLTNSEQTQGKHFFTQHIYLSTPCPWKLLQLRIIFHPSLTFKFKSTYSCILKPREGPTTDLITKLEALESWQQQHIAGPPITGKIIVRNGSATDLKCAIRSTYLKLHIKSLQCLFLNLMFLARIGNYSKNHSLNYDTLIMQSGISLRQGSMGKPHKRLEKDTKGWYKDKKTNGEKRSWTPTPAWAVRGFEHRPSWVSHATLHRSTGRLIGAFPLNQGRFAGTHKDKNSIRH